MRPVKYTSDRSLTTICFIFCCSFVAVESLGAAGINESPHLFKRALGIGKITHMSHEIALPCKDSGSSGV